MKNKTELEQEIVGFTMKIHEEYPELSKYIDEIPEKISGVAFKEISTKNLKDYCNSLEGILTEYSKTHSSSSVKDKAEMLQFPDALSYPAAEDIYVKGKKESELDPEDVSKKKIQNEQLHASNEKEFSDDLTGEDLDVPGSELDDPQELVGDEDEENNYYSIGGDDHDDLDEDIVRKLD